MASETEKSSLGRALTGLAVVLPILSIVFGIVRAEFFAATSQRYVFTVEGYDPRDLLRGHYIQYRLRVERIGEIESCEPGSTDCCLCFSASPFQLVTQGYATRCDADLPSQCSARIAQAYVDEPLRFYVPEARAAEIEARLREAAEGQRAQVVFALDRQGRGVAEELRIDGVSVLASP